MKTTVDFHTFRNAFQKMRPNNFSREGQKILFDYLEGLEKDTGEEMELDVIALCCDFFEGTTAEVSKMYGVTSGTTEDVREYLHQATIVCGECTNINGEIIFVFHEI